jgi:hypothetical protein
MAENLSATGAWDRAFARQNETMGRTPPADPAADQAITKARISDLEGRVAALEDPAAAGE